MRCEAIYSFGTRTVRFAIYPAGMDGPRILAQISEDALRGVFGARGAGESLVHACDLHFGAIEPRALLCYFDQPGEPVVLQAEHFRVPATMTVSAF